MNCDIIHVEPLTKKVKVSSPLLTNDGYSTVNTVTLDTEQFKDHKVTSETMPITIYPDSYKDIVIQNDENNKICSNRDSDEEDDHLFPFPTDDDVTDMLKEVEYTGAFPTTTERYFTPYYKLNVQTFADDMCILLHSNRVCMLSLAPSHAVLQNGAKITKIDFKVSDKLDRAKNKVSGKSKHGAQPLQATSKICVIHCSSGETYPIKCCMIGKLVEVNEKLLDNPECLLQPPHRGGYLAIILPNIKLLDKMKEDLLTQAQYDLATLERNSTVMKEECTS